ncbi:MAG: DUF4124 domain-containing protein [Candidatus Binatia bacterium]
MKLLLTVFLVCLYVFVSPVLAQEAYRWVDEKGAVHFTDNLHSIPEKYWDKAERRILPSGQEPSAPLLQPQSEDSQPAPKSQRFVVPFTRDGNRIIVEGTVNERATVKFILDTVAPGTSIPTTLAERLDVDLKSELPVEVESLKVGEAEARDLFVIIRDRPGFANLGLLGRNFFSEFQIDINREKNELTLEYLSGPYGGHSGQWWQERFRFYRELKKKYEEDLKKLHNLIAVSDHFAWEHMQRIIKIEGYLPILDEKLYDLEIKAANAAVPYEFRQ